MTPVKTIPRAPCGAGGYQGPDAASRLLEMSIQAGNEQPGTLDGYDCPECRNKGYILYAEGGERRTRECACMAKRRSLRYIAESGLSEVLERCTFDRYVVRPGCVYQEGMKKTALDYLARGRRYWLALMGQTGTGKTHLCTAVCKALLDKGFQVRYITWVDFIKTMERLRFKQEQHDGYYGPIKDAEVLYIDDFLKRERGEAAMSIAFDLIDHREKAKRPTILSGEPLIEEIAGLDAALAGRIRQMCKLGEFYFEAGRDETRNWRLMHGTARARGGAGDGIHDPAGAGDEEEPPANPARPQDGAALDQPIGRIPGL